MGAEGHYLAHQHGSQDVGQLVNDTHGGVHVCLIQEQERSISSVTMQPVKTAGFHIHITHGFTELMERAQQRDKKVIKCMSVPTM